MLDEEASSIDKKLKQAKRNSILNSSASVLKIQGIIKDAYELAVDKNSQSFVGGIQQDLSPYSKNDVSPHSGRSNLIKKKKDPFLNRFQKIQTEKTLSHWLKQEKEQNTSKQLHFRNQSISQHSLSLSNNEENKHQAMPDSTQLATPMDKSVVTSQRQSETQVQIQPTSKLLQRRQQMKVLAPVITSNPMKEQENSLQKPQKSQPQAFVRSSTMNDSKKGSRGQSPNYNNSPNSPALSKFKIQEFKRKRKDTIKKFQEAVWKAYKIKKAKDQGQQLSPNIDTAKSLNTQQEFQFQTKSYLEPATPMLRPKMTFFEVVSKLNPFQNKRKRANALDELEEPSNQNLTQRIDSQRELMEKQIQEEIKQKKKERARQLWRKAKSVLRAINIWKSIQNEIQLYGTHNYEFRRNFKLNQQDSNRIKKAQSLRKMNTEEMARKRCKLYIHPESLFKQLWSTLIMSLLFYIGLLLPWSLAFVTTDDIFWYYLDLSVNLIMMFDVVVNAFSAYEDVDGDLVTDNKKIIIEYLKSWFAIDLISSLPISYLEDLEEDDNSSITRGYLSLFKLLKIIRIQNYRNRSFSKVLDSFHRATKNSIVYKIYEFAQINQGRVRLFIFVSLGLICVHVASCIWYFSARMSSFEPDSWVVRGDFQDVSSNVKYLASVYWAVQTVLTVGYGDIHAGTNGERIFAIIWMFLGVAFFAFTIGTLTAILTKKDTRESILNIKIENIDEFCSEANISHDLKKKIRDALEYHSQRNAFLNIQRNNIFNELPVNLKYEIAIQIHDGAIGKLPFFYNKDDAFVANIVPLLQPLKVISGEYIYMLDDHPYDIFFIVAGRVNFLLEVGECVFKTWPAGSYFGEIEVIFHKKRICTAKAEMQCDLFTLNKKYYSTIIYNDYPEIEQQLRDLATEREQRILQTQTQANLVLETIGLQKALLLPMRNRSPGQRRPSLQSMGSSKKKALNSYQKISAQMKITQSFDIATKSIASSKSMSSKRGLQNQEEPEPEQNDEVQKDEDKDEDNSSSSADFNIWGEKEHTSEEESKNSGSPKSDVSNQSQQKSPSKSCKSDQQFKKFASFFKSQRALKGKTNTAPFSPDKYFNQTDRDNIIKEEDKGESESEKQSDTNSVESSVSSNLQIKKRDSSNVFKINVIEDKEEIKTINNYPYSSYDLYAQLNQHKSTSQLWSPQNKQSQQKRYLSPHDPKVLDLIGKEGSGHFTPISGQNNSMQQISFSDLILAVNNRQQSEQKKQQQVTQQIKKQQQQQIQYKKSSTLNLNNSSSQSIEFKVQDYIPGIKINDVIVQKGQVIINNMKFPEDSNQDIYNQINGTKRQTSSFGVPIQPQIYSPQRPSSPLSNKQQSPSKSSYTQQSQQQLSIKTNICKVEIISQQQQVKIEAPNEQLEHLQLNHYQEEQVKRSQVLYNMSSLAIKLNSQVHDLQEKLENSYNEQIILEGKCVGLQDQIQLLAQLLNKFVNDKNQEDKQQHQIDKKTSQQKRREKYKKKSKGSRVLQNKETIEYHKQQQRTTEDQQFMFNSKYDYGTYRQSMDSNAPLMNQQSFTLNSENSLIPISRTKKQSKPSVTTEEDKRKDGSNRVYKFSFTDDLELLQQELQDPQIPSVYSSIDYQT